MGSESSAPQPEENRRIRRGAFVGGPAARRGTFSRGKKPLQGLPTRAGTVVLPGRPLASGGLRRRKEKPPRFWRAIVPALAGAQAVPEYRLNDWLLVLSARKIPHELLPPSGKPRIYVPALYEKTAVREIREFEQERHIPVFVPPVRKSMGGVFVFLFLLFVWHGFRFGWFAPLLPSSPFPAEPGAWSRAFGLDMYRTRELHEWWRTVTALSLHADDSHLFSNLGFGLLFLFALCRRAGLGLGLALTVCAGIAGNACNTLFKNPGVVSIGFSTALFGAVGSLCALAAADIVRHQNRFSHWDNSGRGLGFQIVKGLGMPLAAGLALLGILGGGGEVRTDYSAHILGFCCGIVLTSVVLPLEKRLFSLSEQKQKRTQSVLFLLTLTGICLAWAYALITIS